MDLSRNLLAQYRSVDTIRPAFDQLLDLILRLYIRGERAIFIALRWVLPDLLWVIHFIIKCLFQTIRLILKGIFWTVWPLLKGRWYYIDFALMLILAGNLALTHFGHIDGINIGVSIVIGLYLVTCCWLLYLRSILRFMHLFSWISMIVDLILVCSWRLKGNLVHAMILRCGTAGLTIARDFVRNYAREAFQDSKSMRRITKIIGLMINMTVVLIRE